MSEHAKGTFVGYAPRVVIGTPESRKYEKLWGQVADYRKFAPGERSAPTFMKEVRPQPGSEVIDFGCGTGRGGMMLATFGLRVTMLDFAANCLDPEVRSMCAGQPEKIRFMQHDLGYPSPVQASYGYCTDVMEHIPTADVDGVLINILKAARRCFFQISLENDEFGSVIGETLHHTVQSFDWWLAKFRALDCVILWSENGGNKTGWYYVSSWQDAQELVKSGVLNTDEQVLVDQVRTNVARDLPQACPHKRSETEAMIVCGGPSLLECRDDIVAKRMEGMPLITMNGSYHTMIEWGLKPSLQVVLDGREFNKRFVTPHVDTCKYMLASQCHPATFDAAPADRTWIWHSVVSDTIADVLDESYKGQWWPVPGGSTVMLRTLTLMRMLGWYRFHVYGFDSCLAENGDHHAYAQPENDAKTVVTVNVGDRMFNCHAWMASQAQEFVDQMRLLGDEIMLHVYGRGLIAAIIEQAAKPEG